MRQTGNNFDVIITGAGPSGCSTAIRLALEGVKVLLVEHEKFPRAKLCGEFISPECVPHFRQLGVEADMTSSSPSRITETVFYSSTGRSIKVPSEWFGECDAALGLSRAKMDQNLLIRAKSLGVEVIEEASISEVLIKSGRVIGIRIKVEGISVDCYSRLTIDATGRRRALVKKLQFQRKKKVFHRRPNLVAFKVHLENTRVADKACEIYSYQGGYGGLSRIEQGLSNLCFIAAARDVRHCESNPDLVVANIVSKNPRAAYTLEQAKARTEWLSVSLETFGRCSLVPYPGLITVGDAAAFIDPFTGSGMLMAFESGEIASQAIHSHLHSIKQDVSFDLFAQAYKSMYRERFDSRLRISALLRRAAFVPYAAEAAILFFSISDRVRRRAARATRSNRTDMITSA
jgi:menaquinone-9 beta-reductase